MPFVLSESKAPVNGRKNAFQHCYQVLKWENMNTQRSHHPLLIIILMLVLSAMACTLTAEPVATLPPRTPMSTITPNNPIGPQYTMQPITTPQSGVVIPTSVAVSNPANVAASTSLSTTLNLIDSGRMINTINTLVGFHNRHALSIPASSKGIHAAGDYLTAQFYQIKNDHPDMRIDISQHSFEFEFGGQFHTGTNIMLVINGTDVDAGVVLVGAHYDTINRTNSMNVTVQQPSADDNGSGVAAVLEMARIMAQRPHRATIIFILFSSEELGRKGSIAFLNEYIRAWNIPLRAMINLDTIGSPIGPDGKRHDNEMRIFSAPPNTSTSRQLARQSEFVARYFVPGFRVNVQDSIDRDGRWGDHMTFSGEDGSGYAAIRMIEQADDYNRMDTNQDTIDRIDPLYLSRVTQVTLATLIVLADGPPPPSAIRIDTTDWRLEWLPSENITRYVIALRRPGSLVYNQELTVDGTSFQWNELTSYEGFAIAAVNSHGQIGAFSRECSIPITPTGGTVSC